MSASNPIGHSLWRDLTVKDATGVRDFYKAVVGWTSSDVPMSEETGAYVDFCMHAPGPDGKPGEVVAGICHSRGVNGKIPPQWLVYITVPDVAGSARKCVDLGGKVLDGPRKMGTQTFCVIQDPAGAVAALISP